MTITTAAPAPVALSCIECPTGTYRYLTAASALAACTTPGCTHTVNTNLDLDLDGGEVLTTDEDGNVAYWPADTAGGRIGAQPVASRDGQPHLTYYAAGFSFVWSGVRGEPIEASDGGYGEPVTHLIDTTDTAGPALPLLRDLADDFLYAL